MSTDTKALASNVHQIQEALAASGLAFNVVSFSESTRTAVEAAAAIGCDVAQIAKSIVFKTHETHRPILVLTSGANRVHEKSVAAIVGEKLDKADASFTREATGFAIGGIPPVGHPQKIMTFIDEDLLAFEELWAAAGTPFTVFSLPATSLAPLTQGQVICVKG